MDTNEWEALCDKCGKCCVIKLEDYDTKEIHYTNVSCKLLCEKTALCKDYKNRKKEYNKQMKKYRNTISTLENQAFKNFTKQIKGKKNNRNIQRKTILVNLDSQ